MTRGAVAAALLLTACGAPRSYLGLDLRAPVSTRADREVRALALASRAGDKAAQAELGRRFEDGGGVPVDLDRACRLYEGAARTTGGTIYVYQPPVGKAAGRVVPITTPVSPGVPVAAERLATLRYRVSSEERARSRCLRG